MNTILDALDRHGQFEPFFVLHIVACKSGVLIPGSKFMRNIPFNVMIKTNKKVTYQELLLIDSKHDYNS